MKVIFLWGLPGCGKTMWAKIHGESTDLSFAKNIIVDIDSMRDRSPAKIARKIRSINRHTESVILDGLFTINEQVRNTIEAINKINTVGIEYQIVWWPADREKSLVNDDLRVKQGYRSRHSKITIQRVKFERPSKKLLKTYNIDLMEEKYTETGMVYLLNEADNLNHWHNDDKQYLCSDTWSLGGESWSYDGEPAGSIMPEPQPASFKEFDDLLLKVCPDIAFMQYKKLYNETVTIKTKDDSDYYSKEIVAFYSCDITKLYGIMRELSLI